MSDLIRALTVEDVRELLQAAGYRAETVTDPAVGVTFLRSASNGMNFDIRMGNRVPADKDACTDIVLLAVFNVVGEFPMASLNAWNSSRRFAGLHLDQNVPGREFLVFSMDVIVAGGVSRQCLRTQIDIWDGMLQQLVPWLRDEVAKLRSASEPAAMRAAPALADLAMPLAANA